MGGSQEWEVGFIMGGWEIFEVLLHSWQRGANPLILWRPPYIAYLPFFKCCPPPPTQLSCHLQLPPPLFFLLSCFFSWMGDHTTFDVLFHDNIDLHMSSLGSLVPEGPWCVLSNRASSLLRSDTYNLGQIHLISHTQTHKHTQHTQGPVDWHNHINIYLHHLLIAHSSYLYYIKWLNE